MKKQNFVKNRKIADAHAHIYPHKIAEKATESVGDFYGLSMSRVGTSEALIKSGSKIGVSHYLVCSVATKVEQVESINHFICEECAKHPEFIGLAAYHQDVPDPYPVLEKAKAQGLRGIKVHSDFQHFNIDDPIMMPVYQALIDLDMVILFHMGDSRYDFSAPTRLARVLEKLPALKCIAAHLGGYERWQEAGAVLQGENLYFDTSSSLAFLRQEEALSLIKRYGAQKVMFGSDFPMWSHTDELENFLALGLSEEENRQIFFDNFASLFLREKESA